LSEYRNNDNTQTDLNLSNTIEKIGTKTDFKNNLSFENQTWLIDVQETVTWKKLRFNLGATAKWIDSRLTNRHNFQRNFAANRLLLQPTLGVSTQIGQHQRIMLFYYNQQQAPSSEQFTDGYIQSNYRTFSSNTADFYISRHNHGQLTYSNVNWGKLYSINLGLSYGFCFF
jgi:hypothetical protein